MFLKIKNISEEVKEKRRRSGFKENYSSIMYTAKLWTENKPHEEQLIYLNYLIEVLLRDIVSSGAAAPLILHCKEPFSEPFPTGYYDKNNNWNSIYSDKYIEVNLADTMIYVRPWNNRRTASNVRDFAKKAFVYQKEEHLSHFYTDIDLCYVFNGNHSVNAGRYYKNGKIISQVFETEKLYPYYETDGAYWYNKQTKEKYLQVDDFRLAAVYSLAKMRNGIK